MEILILTIAISLFALALFAVVWLIWRLWDFIEAAFDIAFEIKEDYYDEKSNIKSKK